MHSHNGKVVDVAINVYGKPYNTAVTLYSLLEHSRDRIDRIFLNIERVQPHEGDAETLLALLDKVKERLVVHVPKYHIWCGNVDARRYQDRDYRHSIRYQFGFEATDKKFLLITHNDILYQKDILPVFLEHIRGRVGVGHIGQCWNCPASKGGKCASDRFDTYRPSVSEIKELVARIPLVREPRPKAHTMAGKLWAKLAKAMGHRRVVFDARQPWPLPECRLNEFSCLVDVGAVRPLTIPNGPVVPIGSDEWLDVGVRWFHMLCNQGHKFRHVDIYQYCSHAWAGDKSRGAGHPSLFSEYHYRTEEEDARNYLEKNFL